MRVIISLLSLVLFIPAIIAPACAQELKESYKAQLGEPQQQPSQEQADSLRLNLLRELIDEEIVQQRAGKTNLTATNEEVDAKLAEMKAPYTEEQFDQRLKASNHSLDDVKRNGLDLESRVPVGHPIRTIKRLAEAALSELSPRRSRQP